MIFIPALKKQKGEDGTTQEELERFLIAWVFDITQTFEIRDHDQADTAPAKMPEPAETDVPF